MRKGLAALAAAVFFLSVGGVAQAVVGIPDDVPGSTLLYPFFKVNPARTASDTQDTLLVVTNTAGPTTSVQSGVNPNVAVHVTLWSAASVHVYDFTIILTPNDVWSCSLYDLIFTTSACAGALQAPVGVRSALEKSIGGKTILTGYVTADVVFSPTNLFPGQVGYPFGYGNVLIGHMYLVNLINGSSTGFNAVSIETDDPCYGHHSQAVPGQVSQNSRGFYRTRCEEEQTSLGACAPPVGAARSCPVRGGANFAYGDLGERIDGPNGDWAQTGTAGGFRDSITNTRVGPDSPLTLQLRYFSASVIEARTEVWLWKDRRTTGTAGAVNVAVYDEAENAHSVQFDLPEEVNFALTNQIITPGAPGGWFRITFPCSGFGSCDYEYLIPPGTLGARPPVQSVAYSVQFAQSANASLRWDAVFPAHRQYTDYR
jgi:hypothetical protein